MKLNGIFKNNQGARGLTTRGAQRSPGSFGRTLAATLTRCKLQRLTLDSQDRAPKIDFDKRDSGGGLEVSCRIRSAGDGTHGAIGFKGSVGTPALQAGEPYRHLITVSNPPCSAGVWRNIVR